ncbi:hypothetical protein OB919_17240 [Halobacteria archaeon AArc-curdl1]|uniref:Uncharacterized protein n=1 Tax=Natronosalvus hydrolyticus TaxID=2979988 RepID=A0AAP2ZBW8_9EURY|nr:hypothetical protein [Halobacteria archaeon AArc-curdl1]
MRPNLSPLGILGVLLVGAGIALIASQNVLIAAGLALLLAGAALVVKSIISGMLSSWGMM